MYIQSEAKAIAYHPLTTQCAPEQQKEEMNSQPFKTPFT